MLMMIDNDDDDNDVRLPIQGGPEDVQHAQVPSVRQAAGPSHPPHRPLRVGPLGKLQDRQLGHHRHGHGATTSGTEGWGE